MNTVLSHFQVPATDGVVHDIYGRFDPTFMSIIDPQHTFPQNLSRGPVNATIVDLNYRNDASQQILARAITPFLNEDLWAAKPWAWTRSQIAYIVTKQLGHLTSDGWPSYFLFEGVCDGTHKVNVADVRSNGEILMASLGDFVYSGSNGVLVLPFVLE